MTKERKKEYNKGYRQDNIEKIKEREKKYRQDNKKRIKERDRVYYRDNIEKSKEYRQENIEKLKEYSKKYNDKQRLLSLSYKGGKCLRCESTEFLEFHHRDPDDKEFTIGSRIFETSLDELDKCDLLCKDCHMKAHKHMKDGKRR